MKTSNKGQTTGQKFGFQKQLWKFTAIALNKIIKELNQRNRRRRLRSYGLVNLVGLSKIYSCWFIPDFTRNHVISYTNESRRFLTLITIVAFKSRSINTQTLIVPVCKPSLACCVILARIFLTSILRKERKREFGRLKNSSRVFVVRTCSGVRMSHACSSIFWAMFWTFLDSTRPPSWSSSVLLICCSRVLLLRSFHARLLVIYADVRVTFIPVARGLFKLVGEVGIPLDFVSELSRTKSITFPS